MSFPIILDRCLFNLLIIKPLIVLTDHPSLRCRTPLHYAAANGRYQCTVTLVSAGAEVNEPDQTGCTPLHYSAASQAFSRLEREQKKKKNSSFLFCVLCENPGGKNKPLNSVRVWQEIKRCSRTLIDWQNCQTGRWIMEIYKQLVHRKKTFLTISVSAFFCSFR